MKKTLFLMALLCASLGAGAQEKPWNLTDCINYALDHNLTVQQSALQVAQREVAVNTAKNNRLPGVSAGASQNFSFGRGLNSENTYVNTNTTNTSFSLGADMTLFNGMRNYNNVLLSKLNLEAATIDLEKAKDDIRVAVAKAYVQILYNQEILDVALRQIDIDAFQVERLKTLRDNGKGTDAEVAAQLATLAQSRLTAVQAENNLKISKLDLAQLLELPTPEGFDVVIPSVDAFAVQLPAGPEVIFEEAVGIKPSVKAEETRLAYAERNISLAKGGYLPTLSLNGGLGTNYYTSSGYTSKKFFEQLGTNFSQYVGLSLNIPIFSRMSNRNQVRTAKISYQSQALQLETAKKNLYKEIQQAWYNALASDSKFQSATSAEVSAAESFALIKAKYENGKATVTEFNEAKNRYLKAASDLAQSRYEYLYQTRLLDYYRGHELTF